MITTEFIAGSPCWLDLGATDVAASTAFYRSVFDWEFEPFGPDAGDAGLLRRDGKAVGAIGPLTEEGARSAWMIYFNTPDADTTARAVRSWGGTVRVAPFDIEDEARMAQLTDPQGAQFAVWQARKNQGLEVADMPGALSWIELMTTDLGGAKKFYGSVFGWESEDMSMPGGGGTYSTVTPHGASEQRMHGGIVQLPAEHLDGGPYWHPVFGSADCDATVAKITANGGSVRMGPEDVEGVGRLAVCVDPSGAEFVVLTPAGS